MSILEMIKQGGVSLIPLAVCSLLALTVTLERIWTYSRIGKVPGEVFDRVKRALTMGKRNEALGLLNGSDSPYARVALASLEQSAASVEERTDALTMACESEVALASRPLPVLGTIGNIAPFIGLFGTVLGIMRAFHDVANQGTAGASAVSGGIAEALIATGVGLGVGICAVVANNWCVAWVDNYRRELDHFSTRWMHFLAGIPDASSDEYQDNDTLLNSIETPELEPVV